MVFLEMPLRLSLFLPAGRRRPAIVRRRHDRSRGIVNPLSLMSLWIKGKADSPRSAGLAAGRRRPGLSQQPAGTSSCRRRCWLPRPAAPPAGRDPFFLPSISSRLLSFLFVASRSGCFPGPPALAADDNHGAAFPRAASVYCEESRPQLSPLPPFFFLFPGE